MVFSLFSFWIFPDRECPELPQPEEIGSVNMTGREFGGKAIYSCPIGYNVIGVILLLLNKNHDEISTFFFWFTFAAFNEIVPQWSMDRNAADLFEKQ